MWEWPLMEWPGLLVGVVREGPSLMAIQMVGIAIGRLECWLWV